MNNANTSAVTFATLLHKTLRISRYAKRVLETDTFLMDWLQNNYAAPFTHSELASALQLSGLNLDNQAELARGLRMLRKQVMVKLILRDLNGLADLNEVMHTMTGLAELCIQKSMACLNRELQKKYGRPLDESRTTEQELFIIGMGKLGGGELNVSSDIDLIFIFPEDGETEGPQKISNSEYFNKLGQQLISIINEATEDGFVFRVDMRLRPYGDSGPLSMSFAALEDYLVSQGREWERYAWIKARVISPLKDSQGKALSKLVSPFVYRKYLDFGAIDSMRTLQAQIRQEILRRDRLNNIKLGPGGIREIEFIAQVFQLIRGGQDARLRIRPTVQVLQQLNKNAQLPAQAATDLLNAYAFLRNLEHRLQYLDDEQTQELPNKTADQDIIGDAMGCSNYAEFLVLLDRHRNIVSEQFNQIFGAQTDNETDAQLWHDSISVEELNTQLEKSGYHTPKETALRLQQLHSSNRYQNLPDLSRQRMDKLIPKFIILSTQHDDPDITLFRLLTLLDSISRRAVYLAFLSEYPQALQRLTSLVAVSSWASEYLTQHPALLDELLDAREIYQPPQWMDINHDLQTRLDDSAGDLERQLDILRHCQQEQTFHLLVMDLFGLLPLEALSDHLSELADLLLQHVLRLSWENARKRHRDDARFAIIAYGKLGGKELGYASDVDIIFLYDDDHPDAQENYARLAQRINTMLSSYTGAGRLYETDLRLRPNGASGLLVSSIAAFTEYQLNSAWVWEHQALTRARHCAGDDQIGLAFEEVRKQVLGKQRDLVKLKHDILEMREKMHDSHKNDSGLFDIKHDAGGMVDIEFMVQYLVLAHAYTYPELTPNIGNLALLNIASQRGLIPTDIAMQICDLYRTLRQTQHRMRLNNQSPCRVALAQINTSASKLLWQKLFAA